MKYELPPNNRDCSDRVLLDDLRSVAAQCGKNTVKRDEYGTRGRFNPTTLIKRFGSWNQALETAGLVTTKRQNIPRDELISDLKRVAKKLGRATVLAPQYATHGAFAVGTVTGVFGNWSAALAAASLAPTGFTQKLSDDDLFTNLAQVWENLGRVDMTPPTSKFGHAGYLRRFGGWRKALEAFILAVGEDEHRLVPKTTETPAVPPGTQHAIRHKTSRTISWRMRFMVMRRDSFKCRMDGRSPATHPGTILEVDHVAPWAAGGETVLENLQTLCQRCNGGKSNLEMEEGQRAGGG